MTPAMKIERLNTALLDIELLRSILDLDGDEIVWRHTRRRATIPGLFGTPDQVLVGFVSIDAADCYHALVFNEWPAGADARPEPHIRRGYFEMAWHLMERNFQRAGKPTPEALKGKGLAPIIEEEKA